MPVENTYEKLMHDYKKFRNISVPWKLTIFSFLLLVCASCDDTEDRLPNDEIIEFIDKNYLYVSHTLKGDNSGIFNKVSRMDFTEFDLKILGGDLALNSFENETILNILDDTFDLKNEKTLFSIGNHDETSDAIFSEVTNRNKYNLYQTDDISFVTVDTQDDNCSITGAQRAFFQEVMDTVTTKNIVVLSHKLIFMDQHPILDQFIDAISNGPKGNCSYCLNPNNFRTDVYPILVQAKDRGKEVFWISGDLGKKTPSFEFRDENGIQFLANGLWYESNYNEVLLLNKSDSELTYRFANIESLID